MSEITFRCDHCGKTFDLPDKCEGFSHVGCVGRLARVPAAPAPEATREADERRVDYVEKVEPYTPEQRRSLLVPLDDLELLIVAQRYEKTVRVMEATAAAQAREIETLRADKARHAWCAEVLATVQYRKVHGVTRVTVRSSGGRAYAERDTFAEAVDAARAPEATREAVQPDPSVPLGEIHFVQDGKTVGKIVNVALADPWHEPPGGVGMSETLTVQEREQFRAFIEKYPDTPLADAMRKWEVALASAEDRARHAIAQAKGLEAERAAQARRRRDERDEGV